MKCPYCNEADTKVIDSRPADDNSSIRRRRPVSYTHLSDPLRLSPLSVRYDVCDRGAFGDHCPADPGDRYAPGKKER